MTDADCIKHVTLNMGGTFAYGNDATFIDHVWVFKFMYFVVNGNGYQNVVFKLSGNPRASGSTGTLAYNSYLTGYYGQSNISIRSMQTLEQFGFYMTTYNSNDGSQTVTQY